MDYARFLNPLKERDLIYLKRSIHLAVARCEDILSLALGGPNHSTIPIAAMTFHCPDGTDLKVSPNEMNAAMRYQSSAGMPRLLDWTKKIQNTYHSPPIMDHPDNNSRFSVCITSGGAMGAMSVLYSQVIQGGDVVLLDEFLFPGTKGCLKKYGASMVGVKMDKYGITPESLRDCLENWKDKAIEQGADSMATLNPPKLLHTVPTGQNPTGVVTSLHRKKEIYKIAQEYNILIVEDDPYFYIQFTKELVSSYQSIDTDGRVIRIDSMSKLIAPGIRLGWLSGPFAVVQRVATAQARSSGFPGGCAQLAALKLFDHWGMEGLAKRIDYLQDFYKPKRDEAARLVSKHLSDLVEWYPVEAGFCMWLKLKSLTYTSIFVNMERFEKFETSVIPGSDFSCSDESGPYFRIAFSSISQNQLEEAIIRLKKLITEATI